MTAPAGSSYGARVALVTGAARGIGAAVVDALVADGFHVVALDACAAMPGAAGEPATRADLTELERRGAGRVEGIVLDVRDVGALRDLVVDVEARYGGVDAAVAAAGVIAGGTPLWEAPPGELDILLDVNLRGVAHLASASVPAMLRRPEPRRGRFVAVASAAAHRALWHLTGYVASKHAALGLVRGLAADLAGTGVTANAVSPGSTRTAMLSATAGIYAMTDVEAFAERQAVRRLLEPAEIAAAVRWLCSPESSALTGAVIEVDGGFGM